jgi:hypothetical protein
MPRFECGRRAQCEPARAPRPASSARLPRRSLPSWDPTTQSPMRRPAGPPRRGRAGNRPPLCATSWTTTSGSSPASASLRQPLRLLDRGDHTANSTLGDVHAHAVHRRRYQRAPPRHPTLDEVAIGNAGATVLLPALDATFGRTRRGVMHCHSTISARWPSKSATTATVNMLCSGRHFRRTASRRRIVQAAGPLCRGSAS